MNRSRLKCRWCDYSVAAFYVSRQGEPKSGWPRLAAHQEDCHPDEVDELWKQSREHAAARPGTMDDPR